MYISIAIDGPAGSGKSTITKKLAKKLDYKYIDTGALYRALSYKFIRDGLYELNEEKIFEILEHTEINVYFKGDLQIVEIDGSDITDKIRTPEVSKYTSLFAKSINVRNYLIDIQRNLAKSCNVIVDGRDIGSVVLPFADVKIYLTASVEERAIRRYKELLNFNSEENITLEEIKKSIEDRDYQDKNRKIAPLVKVEDAIEVDTTSMSIEDVVKKIEEVIVKKLNLKGESVC